MRRREDEQQRNLPNGVSCIGSYRLESGIGQAATDNARLIESMFPVERTQNGPGKYRVNYHHGMPPMDVPEWTNGVISTSFWMVETTKIHPLWEESANAFTEIWTGSHASKKAIESLPSHSPVYVIPHYVPVPKIPSRDRGDKFTVFTAMAPPLSRKNPEGAIRAFQIAFEGYTDVELIVKLRTNEHTFRHLTKALANGDPRITFLFDEMPRNVLSWHYRNCDAFLSLQRGGGFELHCAEAASFGLPVITTRVGGVLDYLDDEFAHLIDGKVIPFDGEHLVNAGGTWIDPDLYDAAEALLKVYNYSDERRKEVREKARKSVAEKLSESVVRNALAERINYLLTL